MDSAAQWRLYKAAQLSAQSQAAALDALTKGLDELHELNERIGLDAASDMLQVACTVMIPVLGHLHAGIEQSRLILPHLEAFAQASFVEACQHSAAGLTDMTT
jgi:hypothetical protein